MKSDNMAVTDARLKKALYKPVNEIISSTVPQQIETAVNQLKLYTGNVTKFYPYLDKAEIELSNGELVLSSILHRFGGDLVDYYTPNGDEDYCDTLHEPCIIPKMILPCLAIYADDLQEYVLLGYFGTEDIEEFDPAKMGNVKINWITCFNEYWVEFGDNGLDLRLPSKTATQVGTFEEDMEDVEYTYSDDFYTKKEVDALLNAVAEALEDDET